MEKTLDVRKALEDARQKASSMQMKGREDEVEVWCEVVCGDVLLAEQHVRDQRRMWENASLVREFLAFARPLEECGQALDLLLQAVSRMADALWGHPRLRLELLEFGIRLQDRIAGLHGPDDDACEDWKGEADRLRRNIALADEGKPVEEEGSGHLKRDPVEWTAYWEEIIDRADEEAERALADHPRGMGFCHAWWYERERVLSESFGLTWHSPVVMNPGVMFD